MLSNLPQTSASPETSAAFQASDGASLAPPDGAEQIDVEHDHDARYWARTLHCTEVEVREAVRAVGHRVDDVRRHLGPRTAPSPD